MITKNIFHVKPIVIMLVYRNRAIWNKSNQYTITTLIKLVYHKIYQ